MSVPAVAKKTGKPRAAPAHPSYKDMITTAIKTLNDKKGSSRHAIRKYISENYKVAEIALKNHLNKGLAKLLAANYLVHPKTSTGLWKLAKAEANPDKAKPKTKKTAAKKRTAARKPKADGGGRKTPSKKTKKTTTPAKRAVKKPAKKTVKKAAVKKPAAKKSPKKATKRRPAKKATAAKKK